MKRWLVSSLLLTLTLPPLGVARERPAIGLALGGGSARGIAHVGVIEWLEQQQIPIDYIAGTSMGGLVAGAYATGMSGPDTRALLRDVDWDRLFLGESPYALTSFRRKEDRRQFPVKFELGLRGGVQLPSGFDAAHQIGLVLSRIALPYGSLDDFDDLPTPFRCVATDLERAETVVLGEGSLSQALLASMAIPALFPPVRRDGRVLADGGLLDNVPADVVKAMGADVVIAVDVGAFDESAEGESAFTAASHAIDVMMASTTRRILRESADIVVRPDLRNVGSFDWRRSDEVADAGRLAAEAHAEFLERYRVSDAEWADYLEERRSRRRVADFEPAFIDVQGAGQRFAPGIERRLKEFVGTPLDYDAWDDTLTSITGAGRFQSLRYEAALRDDWLGLRVLATEKSYGPPFLRFSLGISNENQDVAFDFGARVTALDVGKTGAEVRIDGDVGARMGGSAEYYLPIWGRTLFVAPRAFYFRDHESDFADGVLVANRRERRGAFGADVGFTTSRRLELRLGYRLGDVESVVRVGDPELAQPAGREALARLRFVYDGHNGPVIPTRGLRSEVDLEWYEDAPGARRTFGRAKVDLTGFVPRGAADTIYLAARAGAAFGGEPPLLYDFTLGGPFRLSAFDLDEFRGDNLLYGAAGYLRAIGRLPELVGGPVYLAGLVETGSVFDDVDAAEVQFAVGGGLILETGLGPLFAMLSGGRGGELEFYVAIGRFLGRAR